MPAGIGDGRRTDRHRESRCIDMRAEMAQHQIIERDFFASRHDHCTLDGVLQLADVARPIVRQDPVPRVVGEAGNALPVLRRITSQELLGQQLNVIGALAKRRQIDLHDGKSIIQVLAQLTFAERLLQIPVRCSDDANVDRDLLLASEAAHRARFERAQQLHLNVRRHLRDLVEEERAAARHLERTGLFVRRSGERALFVTE